MMDDEKKGQITQLAGGMFGVALEGISAHDMTWETCVFSAMLTAKMLGTMALTGGLPLPGFKCDLADDAALQDKLREILEQVMEVSTIAHRVDSPEELEAFVERVEGASSRTTH